MTTYYVYVDKGHVDRFLCPLVIDPFKNSIKKIPQILYCQSQRINNDSIEFQGMLEHVYCFKYHYQVSMFLLKDLSDYSFLLGVKIFLIFLEVLEKCL